MHRQDDCRVHRQDDYRNHRDHRDDHQEHLLGVRAHRGRRDARLGLDDRERGEDGEASCPGWGAGHRERHQCAPPELACRRGCSPGVVQGCRRGCSPGVVQGCRTGCSPGVGQALEQAAVQVRRQVPLASQQPELEPGYPARAQGQPAQASVQRQLLAPQRAWPWAGAQVWAQALPRQPWAPVSPAWTVVPTWQRHGSCAPLAPRSSTMRT